MKTNVVLALLFLGITGPTSVAQTMSFFRQFNTPGIDQATAVAADASGIYVIGTRPGKGGAGVRKYDSRGSELWTREISASAPEIVRSLKALADSSGLYVLGVTCISAYQPLQVCPAFLRKYSVDGAELWTLRPESFGVADATVDATGVYVIGYASSSRTGYLRKYNSDGAELWTRQLGETNLLYVPFGMTVDSTGIYVFGILQRSGPGNPQFPFARKYDLRGDELWTRQPNWVSSEFPWAFAAANPTGYYIATVEVQGIFLRKNDADGNELWSRRVGTRTDAGPIATPSMVADATGVYLSTSTISWITSLPGHCRSGSGGDALVRKYGPDGAELWTRQFGTADAALPRGVAVDDTGIYVVGQEGSVPFREDWGDFLGDATSDAFLAKFEKTAATPAGSGPRIFSDCVVNAASYAGGGVAPGEIVTIFGAAMGPPELVPLRLTDDRRLADNLADTRLLFNGVPAPLLYVSDKQSSAVVPYSVAGQPFVDVQVEYKGVRSQAVTVPVLTSRPGIFSLDGSGLGQAAILNEDGTLNSPSNPARKGSVITLYGTGGGEAAPGVLDGQIVDTVLPLTKLPVAAVFDVGGLPSKQGEVLYAGGVKGSVAGLLQVNVRVPANAVATGDRVSFALNIGSHWTLYQVTFALR